MEGKVAVILLFLSFLACTSSVSWGRRSGKCLIEGIYRTPGRFITRDCKSRCNCNHDGRWSCKSLCASNWIYCPRGQRKITVNQKVRGAPRCTCKVQKCVPKKKPGYCIDGGQVHRAGTTYLNENCHSCICRGPGFYCTTLCPRPINSCPKGYRKTVKYYWVRKNRSCRCRQDNCI